MYEKYGDDIDTEFKKYNRQKKIKRDIEKIFIQLNTNNNKIIRQALYATIKSTQREIKGVKFDYDVTKIVNSDMSGLIWTERQGMNRDYTIKKVQETLTRGFRTGERYSELAKQLKKDLNTSEYKANRIIRTEAHRCLNDSRNENYLAAQKAGYKVRKEWIASVDERTRSSHAELHGQVVDVDEPFIINGYEAQYPGGFGIPELDINCRCTTALVIEED